MDKEDQVGAGIKTEIVCPHCFKPLAGASVLPAQADRYDRITRKYFGWCINCHMGCEVVQFHKYDKWHIHKYRYYAAALPIDKPVPDRQWTELEKLPEPAPVVTGPGGDYDRPCSLENKTHIEILQGLQKAIKAMAQAVECLLRSLRA